MTIKSKLALAVILVMMSITAIALAAIPLKVSSKLQEKQHEEVSKKAEEEKFEAWLDQLSALECRNCGSRFRLLDANGRYSYGCLQFQEGTFRAMAKAYSISIKSDDGESIYSCTIQKRIARAMFKDDAKAASRHWYNSIYKKGLGLPPLPL